MKKRRMKGITKATLRGFIQSIPRILKYQLVTKPIFTFALFPLFWALTRQLMANSGIHVLTNNTLRDFLLTKEGLGVLLIGLILIFLGIVFESFGFIAISASVIKGRGESSYLTLVKENIKLLPKLFGFGGILLAIYLLIFIPLSGSGFGLSFLSKVKIPNFISEAIDANPLYLALYAALVLLILLVSIRWIFTFHFMVIGGMDVNRAMRNSATLFKRHQNDIYRSYFWVSMIITLILAFVAILWLVGIGVLSMKVDLDRVYARSVMLGLLMMQTTGLFLVSTLFIPLQIHFLTELFYRLVKNDAEYAHLYERVPNLKVKTKMSALDRFTSKPLRLLALLLLGMAILAVPLGYFFEDLLPSYKDIRIVAHRAGGFSAQENSLAGLNAAIEQGADFTEVDVQRTKDNQYVLNHDQTLKRAAGVSEKTQDLSLDEIKKLTLEPHGKVKDPQKIPTVEEFLLAAKGKIQVFLELKGSTADEKMVDDIIALVRKLEMEKDVVLVSLDYKIIQYIESKYKEMESGYIYFLAVGDISALEGDYLIFEEGVANPSKIEEVHEAGKKSVVWTVNTDEAIIKFLESNVDAIITDDVPNVKLQMTARDSQSAQERLLNLFFPK